MPTPNSGPQTYQVAPPIPKRRKPFPTKWLVVGIFVCLGTVTWVWRATHPADKIGPLVLATVTKGNLLESVSATGSVEAQTGAQIRIGSQVTGRIKRLYVDVGTTVMAGQVIAVLDLPDVTAAVDQAKDSDVLADSKILQSRESLRLGESQTMNAVEVAKQAVASSIQALKTAQANYRLQSVQTPTDIRKAIAAKEQADAAVATAQATYDQTVEGAKLNIATAQETLEQSKASLALNEATYRRQKMLDSQGFVSKLDVDQARQAYLVSDSAVRSNAEAVNLVKQKVDADLKTSHAALVQAQKGKDVAIAALEAAHAEAYTTKARLADVNNARAAVRQAQANLALANGNLETNLVNQENIVQAVDAKKAADQQVVINQAQYDKTILRSPIAGTVLSLTSQQGETVAAGLAAPTLVVVTDLHRLEVEAYVDETDIGKVRLGMPATVTVDAFPGKTFNGKVVKSASGSTIQEGVITYDVTISINNTDLLLRPDMTANITIQTGHRSNVLLLPAIAVQQTISGSFVKIATKKDGQTNIRLVAVTTGGTDGVSVEIVSGVKEGDQVVLAGGLAHTNTAAKSSPLAGGGSGRGR